MNTTPLWVPLVVAALGLVSTGVGIVVTQVMANRRERANWTRELERERQRWQREDEALTFEHRRIAYVEFFEALRKMQVSVEELAMGPRLGETHAQLDDDWQINAWEKLQHLELYATPRVGFLAREAFLATLRWGENTEPGEFGRTDYRKRESLADGTKAVLLLAIRADLRVPDTTELDEIVGIATRYEDDKAESDE